MKAFQWQSGSIAVLFWFLSTTVQGETVLVAVASNFTKPMAEIAEAFAKATGHEANLSFGSSGKFVAQIENDAPFELFLSADEKNPLNLEESGIGVPGSRFTYAIGKLALWSSLPGWVDGDGKILRQGGFKHLALADPKLAPYGVAAENTMKSLGVYDKLKPMFVLGENISQTLQFISSGNAELGFVSLAQIVDKDGRIVEGSAWIVPDTLHPSIRQDAVLLKKGESNPAAIAMLGFLKSSDARTIIQKYGYSLP